MEKEKDLRRLLGTKNFDILVKEVEVGSIDKNKLKSIATVMELLRVFNDNENLNSNDLFREILDEWYKTKIGGEDVNAVQLMRDILNDDRVNQTALANRLCDTNSPTQDCSTIETELPKKFSEKLDLQEAPDEPATLSNKYPSPSGTKHAIGLSIMDILEEVGLDCDLAKVVSDLDEGSPRFPSEFDGKHIKVMVTENDGEMRSGEIELEIQVKSGETSFNDFTFAWNQKLEECSKFMRMIVTWDLTSSINKRPVTHCLLCREVSPDKKTFHCLNSWEAFKDPEPQVPSSRVCAVDYVSVSQIIEDSSTVNVDQ